MVNLIFAGVFSIVLMATIGVATVIDDFDDADDVHQHRLLAKAEEVEMCSRRSRSTPSVDPHYPDGGGIPINDWLQQQTEDMVKLKRSLGFIVDERGEEITTSDGIVAHNAKIRHENDLKLGMEKEQERTKWYKDLSGDQPVVVKCAGAPQLSNSDEIQQTQAAAVIEEISTLTVRSQEIMQERGDEESEIEVEQITWRSGAGLPETATMEVQEMISNTPSTEPEPEPVQAQHYMPGTLNHPNTQGRPEGLSPAEYEQEVTKAVNAFRIAEERNTAKVAKDNEERRLATPPPQSPEETLKSIQMALESEVKQKEAIARAKPVPLQTDDHVSLVETQKQDNRGEALYETRIEKLQLGRPLTPKDVKQLPLQVSRQENLLEKILANIISDPPASSTASKSRDGGYTDCGTKVLNTDQSQLSIVNGHRNNIASEGDNVLIEMELFIMEGPSSNLPDVLWNPRKVVGKSTTTLRHVVSGFRAFQLGSPCLSLTDPNSHHETIYETKVSSSTSTRKSKLSSNHIFIQTPFLSHNDYEPQNRFNTIKGIHDGLRGAKIGERRSLIINGCDHEDGGDVSNGPTCTPVDGWRNAFGAKGNARLLIPPYTCGPFVANVTLLAIRSEEDGASVDDKIFEKMIRAKHRAQSKKDASAVSGNIGHPNNWYSADVGECIVGTRTLFETIDEQSIKADTTTGRKNYGLDNWEANISFEEYIFANSTSATQQPEALLIMVTKGNHLAESDIDALGAAASLYQLSGKKSFLNHTMNQYYKKVLDRLSESAQAEDRHARLTSTEAEMEKLLRGPLSTRKDARQTNFGSTRFNELFIDVSARLKQQDTPPTPPAVDPVPLPIMSTRKSISSTILDLTTNPKAFKTLSNPHLLANFSVRMAEDSDFSEIFAQDKAIPIPASAYPKLYVVLRWHSNNIEGQPATPVDKKRGMVFSIPHRIQASRTTLDYIILMNDLNQLVSSLGSTHEASSNSEMRWKLALFGLLHEARFEYELWQTQHPNVKH